jgi:hypothetical protein
MLEDPKIFHVGKILPNGDHSTKANNQNINQLVLASSVYPRVRYFYKALQQVFGYGWNVRIFSHDISFGLA